MYGYRALILRGLGVSLNCTEPWCAFLQLCCEILLRTSHCAHFRKDVVFIKNSSYIFLNLYSMSFCSCIFLLINTGPDAFFIGSSVHWWKRLHTALSVWSCMAAFACRISRTNCSYWKAVDFNLKSIWINEEVEWQSVIKFGNNHGNFVFLFHFLVRSIYLRW